MREGNRLESVHFLRFFAAAVVVVHHSMQYYGSRILNGASGVDIFFVISGVVIGLGVAKGTSASRFALKRLIRVMPLYWVATLIYAGVRYFAWGAPSTGIDLFRSFVLWPSFGTTNHLIYWPAWTLEYEMLFYGAVFAFLCIFGRSARAITAIVFCIAAAARIPIAGSDSYFESSLCIEFVAGIGIAIAVERTLLAGRPIGAALVAGALILLCANNYRGEDTRVLYWGVPATMLVFGMLSFESAACLKGKIVQVGGEASYAIYLAHLTAIEYFGYLGERLHLLRHELSIVNCFALSLIALACGLALHVCIERPLLAWLNKLVRVRRIVAPATSS